MEMEPWASCNRFPQTTVVHDCRTGGHGMFILNEFDIFNESIDVYRT